MCARDPNDAARARAKELDRQKHHTFANKKVGFFNKETTWDKNRKFITGMGLSRDYSDIASSIEVARGKGFASKEILAKKFYGSKSVNEGGRSRNYKKSALTAYLVGQSQIDSQLAKMYGIGQATALQGVKRQTAARLAKNRSRLGLPNTFGPATAMPPKGDTTMANLGIGLTLASIAFPFMAPKSMLTSGALNATGTAVASGLAAGGSMLTSMGSQPYWES